MYGGRDFRCARRFRMHRRVAERGIERAGGGPFDQQGDEISDAASVEPTERGHDQVLDHPRIEIGVTLNQSGSDDVEVVLFAVAHDDNCPPSHADENTFQHNTTICDLTIDTRPRHKRPSVGVFSGSPAFLRCSVDHSGVGCSRAVANEIATTPTAPFLAMPTVGARTSL